MQETRRDFLKLSLSAASWALLPGCATLQQCAEIIRNRPMRRDVNTLSADAALLTAYRSAVTRMRELPESDPRNWRRQASIHNDFCPHGNWLFLPWHRAYLYYFERICRKLSGMADFALPYWNWTKDPSVPGSFWGPGNVLNDTTRQITPSDVASPAAVGSTVIQSILDDSNFLTFGSQTLTASQSQRERTGTGRLEGTPHNYIHGFINGNMGNFMSPLDPIFWLHHNNIERLWVDWNLGRDHANPNDDDWLNRRFTEFCDEDGHPVEVTVRETLLYPIFAYRFDDSATTGTAGLQTGQRWKQINRDTTPAEQKENLRLAQRGGRIGLNLLRRTAAPAAAVATLERAAVFPLRSTEVPRAAGGDERLLLSFSQVSMAHTGDFTALVFLNLPQATAQTPITDPHFVGSFSFFDHQHGNAPESGNFLLDATAALKRLGLPGDAVEVNLVLAPFPGRTPRTRDLQIGAVELRAARDVIERSP